jgi:hypothetical protein
MPFVPGFNATSGLSINATKGSFEAGTLRTLDLDLRLGWEGPTPTEAEILGYLDTLHNALTGDGWTEVTVRQAGSPVSREAEPTP